MKQIRYALLAGTIMSGFAGLALAQESMPPSAPLVVAQAAPAKPLTPEQLKALQKKRAAERANQGWKNQPPKAAPAAPPAARPAAPPAARPVTPPPAARPVTPPPPPVASPPPPVRPVTPPPPPVANQPPPVRPVAPPPPPVANQPPPVVNQPPPAVATPPVNPEGRPPRNPQGRPPGVNQNPQTPGAGGQPPGVIQNPPTPGAVGQPPGRGEPYPEKQRPPVNTQPGVIPNPQQPGAGGQDPGGKQRPPGGGQGWEGKQRPPGGGQGWEGKQRPPGGGQGWEGKQRPEGRGQPRRERPLPPGAPRPNTPTPGALPPSAGPGIGNNDPSRRGGEFRRWDPERRESRDDDRRDRGLDDRFRRREERDGDRFIIREGDDRLIIRENGRTIIRYDETERFRRGRGDGDVRVERDRDGVRTIIRRPGGFEIIVITDDNGRLIRRIRRDPDGRETVLIDNRPRRSGIGLFLDLPQVVVNIPREEYIVESEGRSYEDFEMAFTAPPVEYIDRPYSLEEVRQNVRLRDRVRSVDVNTIVFGFGEWTVPPEQIAQLEEIARAIGAVIQRDPSQVFLIEGHTDTVGSDVDNLSLSDRRAEEVAAILTDTFQIPAENLVTQGYGEQYLRVDVEGPEQENRRVTLRNITPLLNAHDQTAPTPPPPQ
jgi:outer membrane protein OmpA-like peptidoglycan-associated protein